MSMLWGELCPSAEPRSTEAAAPRAGAARRSGRRAAVARRPGRGGAERRPGAALVGEPDRARRRRGAGERGGAGRREAAGVGRRRPRGVQPPAARAVLVLPAARPGVREPVLEPRRRQYSVLAQAPPPNPMRVGAPKGAITHLDEYQAYEKRAGDASLRVTLSDLLLQTIDDNNRLGGVGVPGRSATATRCAPSSASTRARTPRRRAVTSSTPAASRTSRAISTRGGRARRRRRTRPARCGARTTSTSTATPTTAGPARPGVMALHASRAALKVPLGSVRPGELFAVHVSLEAEAVDDRGGESAAQAFIQDPQKRSPVLLTTHGLRAARQAALQGAARAGAAGGALPGRRAARRRACCSSATPAYTANESAARADGRSSPAPAARTGSASVTRRPRAAGSAQAGRDFKPTTHDRPLRRRRHLAAAGRDPAARGPASAEPAETFTRLARPRALRALGAQRRADGHDRRRRHAARRSRPSFTIGGTVDGLQGSGLVLTNLGTELPVAGNGPFTFPGTRADGLALRRRGHDPAAQPRPGLHREHGRGTVPAPT